MRLTPLAVARLLILILVAVNLYRAATTSISTDEAYTYNRSVSVRIPELWETFDANDHVLHTLLCKVAVKWFGVSEFTLRIPSLLGGVLMLWMCLRLSRLLFGDGWQMLLAFALLVLNPLILDYCSIARGYGMAVALLLAALDQLMRVILRPVEMWRLYIAAVTLALGVCANLTVVIPGLALLGVFATFYLGPAARERNWFRFRARIDAVLDRMVVPGVLIVTVVLLFPLLPAKRQHFYIGADYWTDSLISMGYACLWRPGNLWEHTALHRPVQGLIEGAALLLPALILGLGFYHWLRNRQPARALLFWTAAATVALLVAMHAATGLRLPERRTGLYLVPLFTLLAAIAMETNARLKSAGRIATACVLAQFLISWNVRYYDEWNFDAGNRTIMEYLRDHAPADGRKVNLYVTFPLGHSVEFYRRLFHLDWLQAQPAKLPEDGYDVYLLPPEQFWQVEKYHLQERYVHPVSLITIATGATSPLRP